VLLKNHGVFTIGPTAEAAVKAAVMVEELFGAMQTQRWGDLDHSAVMRVIELLCDVEVRMAEG
jgi:ribulose-5-phosphate 4-epimerase/fuculose-1-phosphate aldolase